MILLSQGEFAQARTALTSGVESARQSGQRIQLTRLLLGLSKLNRLTGDLEAATKQAQEALLISGGDAVQLELCQSHLNLAQLALARDDFYEAEQRIIETVTIAQAVDDPEVSAELLLTQAQYHEGLADISVAKRYFGQALALGEQHAMYECRALALFGLARLALRLGQVEEAGRFGRQSHDMLASAGYHQAESVKAWLDAAALVSVNS